MEQESVKKESGQDEDVQVLTAGAESTKLKKEHPSVDENLNLKTKVEEEEIKILSSTEKKEPVKKEKEEPIIEVVEKSTERIKMDKPPEMIKAEKLPEMITIEDQAPEKVVKTEVKEEMKKKVPVIDLDEEKERVKMETKQPQEEEVMVVDEEKEEELILAKETLAPPTKKLKVEESPEKKVTFDTPLVQEEKLEKPEEKEEKVEEQPSEVEMMETVEKTPEVSKTLEETKKVDENQNPEETPKRKVQKRKTILKPTPATPTKPARDLRNRSEIHKPDVFQPEPIKSAPKRRRSYVSKGKQLQQSTPESQGEALSLKTLPQVATSSLNGLTFVVTGTLPSFQRDTVIDFITKHGGRVTQNVSKKTNFMLVGHDPGEKKLAMARTLHKACLSEDEFLDLVRQLDVPEGEAVKPQAA